MKFLKIILLALAIISLNINAYSQDHNATPERTPEQEAAKQTEKLQLKVFKTQKEIIEHKLAVGTTITNSKTYLKVAVSNGFVHLTSIQSPAKKRMSIAEFLRGIR